MDPLAATEIGGTGLRVTRLGMGGAPLGGFPAPLGAELAVVEHSSNDPRRFEGKD